MAEKLETNYWKLERLVKWEHSKEVNEMLLRGDNPRDVSRWCKDHGFIVSHPKLYEYRQMLQEAISKEITIEKLMGIGLPKKRPAVMELLGVTNSKEMARTDLEVLDLIIQRGFATAATNPDVKITEAMKAIEIKNRITGGNGGGLTTYGLEQIRELEQAKINAILEVVVRYVPQNKWEELQEAIEEAERKFYEENAPQFLEEYEKQIDMQAQGDNTVVSDTKF
jgi:hypothetical protein